MARLSIADLKRLAQSKPLSPSASALQEQEGQGALAAKSALALSFAPGKLPMRGVKLGASDADTAPARNTEKWVGIAIGGGLLATAWRMGLFR